jgi:arylsulfatase A-like enzyme
MIFLAFNLVDVGYFPFTRKRATSDLFEQIGGQSDIGKLLPQFARDYWWLIFIFVLIIFLLINLYNRISLSRPEKYERKPVREWLYVTITFFIVCGLATLGLRGGFQRVPIDVVNAGSMTSSEQVPIVLNTPFTLIKSMGHQSLEETLFFSEQELESIYSPIHHYKDSFFRKKNVVVLILESFSKEYTKLGNRHGVTPFLDSLMEHSLVFTNAFSNGTKSIEGIPAILSGLPSLMENPFINSIYANNEQTSLATLLKQEGYTTAFFHGGINGTMNFTDWAPSAGFDKYYGQDEYSNNDDFDGYWGIWDEPFLQFSIKKMNEYKQPFLSSVFTLSSHHPYFIPQKYRNRFKKRELENAESIQYADHALKQFFNEAQKTEWYKNTLFVLTADHAGISSHPFYSHFVGNLSIPILFYEPGSNLKGTYKNVFSQIDILPSTMALLGYNKPFFAFGQSFSSNKTHHCFYYANATYHQYKDSMTYRYNKHKLTSVYNYKKDSLLYEELVNRYPQLDSIATREYRAFIQTYNHVLITNSGVLKKSFGK